jgi:hypothetical protein
VGIKDSEERLYRAAGFNDTTPLATKAALLSAAIVYGKAKIKGWKKRDAWKVHTRLESMTNEQSILGDLTRGRPVAPHTLKPK